MSWDIYLIRTKTNTEQYDDIIDENIVGFTKKEICDEIITLAKEFDLSMDDLDTSYIHLRGEKWSMEFCFWEEEEIYDTVEVQVRGINEPTEILARMQVDLNARIFDMHNGKFIDAYESGAFDEWKDFTDKIIEKWK